LRGIFHKLEKSVYESQHVFTNPGVVHAAGVICAGSMVLRSDTPVREEVTETISSIPRIKDMQIERKQTPGFDPLLLVPALFACSAVSV